MTGQWATNAKAAALDLGRIGIWSATVRFSPQGAAAAAELEQLGFKTVWIPGGTDAGVLDSLDRLLDATSTLKFATGIINVWKHAPEDIAAWWHGQPSQRQNRLFLGLGVSHGPLIGEAWQRPVAKMRAFVTALASNGMPTERLCIAALGPKMLEFAGNMTAGAHPYMVSTRHTALARQIMGPEAVLAPEQGVVLESDPAKARVIAREFVRHYARLPNYTNNWRRDGFSETDISELSDRLVDDLIVCGDLDAIAERVDEHIAAGANHVCLQAIGPGGLINADIGYDQGVWQKISQLRSTLA